MISRFIRVLIAMSFVLAAAALSPAEASSPPGKYVVLSVPRLEWADIADSNLPNINRLLSQSAVGSLSIRALGPLTSTGEAYATISAGNRADVPGGSDGATVLMPNELSNGTTASDIYLQRTGRRTDAQALQIGVNLVRQRNDKFLYGAKVGALAQALNNSNKSIAAIGNADTKLPNGDVQYSRSVGLMAADKKGEVEFAELSPALTKANRRAITGVIDDPTRISDLVNRFHRKADVTVVQLSDLERIEYERPETVPHRLDEARRIALKRVDENVGRILEAVNFKTDRVMLISPVSPASTESLTTIAIGGHGINKGQLISATTRRSGFVTLPDIAPTILDFYGIDQPKSMTGTPITTTGSAHYALSTADDLAHQNDVSMLRNELIGPFAVVYVLFILISLALVILSISMKSNLLRDFARAVVAMVLLLPILTFLAGLFDFANINVAVYILTTLLIAGVIAAVITLTTSRENLVTPLYIAGILWTLIAVDILTGAHLQIDTIFGYSPIIAGRFAGMGNLAFSLFAASALILAAAMWNAPVWGNSNASPKLRHIVVVSIMVATLLIDGMPFWGSDVGGVLTLVPSLGVLYLLLRGSKVNWKRISALLAAAIGLLAVFAAIDLSRPADERTHLGRFAHDVLNGQAGDIFQRKIQANISILMHSVYVWIIPIVIVFFAYLAWKRHGFLARADTLVPGLRACYVAGLVACVVGFALNDSGVAIPAMILSVLVPSIAYYVNIEEFRNS